MSVLATTNYPEKWYQNLLEFTSTHLTLFSASLIMAGLPSKRSTVMKPYVRILVPLHASDQAL